MREIKEKHFEREARQDTFVPSWYKTCIFFSFSAYIVYGVYSIHTPSFVLHWFIRSQLCRWMQVSSYSPSQGRWSWQKFQLIPRPARHTQFIFYFLRRRFLSFVLFPLLLHQTKYMVHVFVKWYTFLSLFDNLCLQLFYFLWNVCYVVSVSEFF